MTTIVHKSGRCTRLALRRCLRRPETAKDQFVHYHDDGQWHLSYGTTIAVRPAIGPETQFVSTVTSGIIPSPRLVSQSVLGEATAATRKRIKSGQYVLANLNV